MSITGLSSYGAGVIVVGAARLALVAAMFLLFSRLSGSARTAGLGVAIYTGNFNFLFWGAQYSYESLALPLLVRDHDGARRARSLAARAGPASGPCRWCWAPARSSITHHLTSYALVVFLAALALTYWALRRAWGWANPWRFAVVAALLAVGWLLLVANSTIGYLSPVLTEAFESVLNTASGEAPPRALFQGKGPVDPGHPDRRARRGPARRGDPRRRPAGRPGASLAPLPPPAVRRCSSRWRRSASSAPWPCGSRRPPGRPATGPASSSSSASPSSLAVRRAGDLATAGAALAGTGAAHRLPRHRPRRRRDLGLALGHPAGAAAAGPGRRPDDRLAAARRWPNGRGENIAGRPLRRPGRRRPPAARSRRSHRPRRRVARRRRHRRRTRASKDGSCRCCARTTCATWSSTGGRPAATGPAATSSRRRAARRRRISAGLDR